VDTLPISDVRFTSEVLPIASMVATTENLRGDEIPTDVDCMLDEFGSAIKTASVARNDLSICRRRQFSSLFLATRS